MLKKKFIIFLFSIIMIFFKKNYFNIHKKIINSKINFKTENEEKLSSEINNSKNNFIFINNDFIKTIKDYVNFKNLKKKYNNKSLYSDDYVTNLIYNRKKEIISICKKIIKIIDNLIKTINYDISDHDKFYATNDKFLKNINNFKDFFINFIIKNGNKNEFEDLEKYKIKLDSLSRTKISPHDYHKIIYESYNSIKQEVDVLKNKIQRNNEEFLRNK